jgi:hypothetical protein
MSEEKIDFNGPERILCPVCHCTCYGKDRMHRHMEEKHDNLNGPDQELMEKTSGKELLNE